MTLDDTDLSEAELDQVFQALADQSRRRILKLLRQAHELRVGDIAAAFDMSLNGVSKHLKILERAGLIHRQIRGREHWLTPDPARLRFAARYFNLIEDFWHDRLVALESNLLKHPQGPKKD